ncbi:MAG TPA: ThiF family adenylyltransferase, partial [Candidatus Hodarchaeales archaeon]|nr:ThiF family adenylyltransferase [Candidatus Hodarchaeales archaeon]
MSTKNSQDDVVLNYYDENKDDRTERHFGGEKFSRIQNSKVLVVGVGAVGNEVVKNLIMLGVRHLTIVDPDTVSNSNVNRC